MRAPIYIAADAGDPESEMAIRLPKEIALKLLMVLALTGQKTLPESSSRPSRRQKLHSPRNRAPLMRYCNHLQ